MESPNTSINCHEVYKSDTENVVCESLRVSRILFKRSRVKLLHHGIKTLLAFSLCDICTDGTKVIVGGFNSWYLSMNQSNGTNLVYSFYSSLLYLKRIFPLPLPKVFGEVVK